MRIRLIRDHGMKVESSFGLEGFDPGTSAMLKMEGIGLPNITTP
jgi:hypothetical protein